MTDPLVSRDPWLAGYALLGLDDHVRWRGRCPWSTLPLRALAPLVARPNLVVDEVKSRP